MRNMNLKIIALLATCAAATSAYAAPITCNGSQSSGARILTLDTAATGSCFAVGLGNFGDSQLEAFIGGGVSLLERDTANANGGLLSIGGAGSPSTGTFSFSGAGATSYLWFHFGNGPDSAATNPDYFIFQLSTPSGSASGTWTTSGANAEWTGLSNIAVLSTRAVPEPATLALLGMGLVGVGLARRRKKA